MISAIDAAVEFEVSIGNYGNKLDEHLPPCVSTTQPSNAVFDGQSYYYLPWGDDKPSVNVDCHWEDVLFRLEAVNLLLGIAERLVSIGHLWSVYASSGQYRSFVVSTSYFGIHLVSNILNEEFRHEWIDLRLYD